MSNNNNIKWLVEALYKTIADIDSNCTGACCYNPTSGSDGPIDIPDEKICKMMTKDKCLERRGAWSGSHSKCKITNSRRGDCVVIIDDNFKKCIHEGGCSVVSGHDFQRKCKCDALGGRLKDCPPGSNLADCCAGITPSR